MNLKGLRQILRYIRDGFKNIWNHLFMSISSIVTLTITLSLCAVFVLFAENTNQLTRQVESEVKIFAELYSDIPENELRVFMEELESLSIVDTVDFRTNDEEYMDIVEIIAGGDEELGDFLQSSTEENPLYHTLTIATHSPEDIPELVKVLDNRDEYVAFSDFGGDSTLDTLIEMTTSVRTIMLIIVLVLTILAVFLIQNTIRITIHSRQEELKIMQLVGASIPHITIPFIIEGIIIGIIGAAFPILITLVGYPFIFEVQEGMFIIPMFQLASPEPLIFQIGFVIGLISIAVSILGSLLAVTRHVFRS